MSLKRALEAQPTGFPDIHTWRKCMSSKSLYVNLTYKRKVTDNHYKCTFKIQNIIRGFPGGAVVRNLPANAGDTGPSPGPGGSHMLRSN